MARINQGKYPDRNVRRPILAPDRVHRSHKTMKYAVYKKNCPATARKTHVGRPVQHRYQRRPTETRSG